MTTSPEVPTAAPTARPLRVLHFVSGGFSGATQVAIDLCGEQPGQQTLLVLRRRASVDPAARVAQLRALGLQVEVVPKWSHSVTIVKLARICRDGSPTSWWHTVSANTCGAATPGCWRACRA